MSENYFEVIRAGINTTFQDNGRKNLNHIGIPASGAIDKRNYKLVNKILNNDINHPALEFAYQGPKLIYYGEPISIAVTGDVNFKLIRKDIETEGKCYESITIENNDEIDLISTNKSVYGYFSVTAKFQIDYQWKSCSTNTKANIGANNGKKLENSQKLHVLDIKEITKRSINYINTRIENIRVIRGTNFDYFSKEAQQNFFSEEFNVTKLSDRMGMRLEGKKLENVVNTNIKSEGLVKGVIQVPADGNPIIMLSDHGTIGGYPKIATVISADFDKLAQLPPGSKIKFKEVNLSDAETIFKLYEMETNTLLSKIT
tara:strand:- start:2019 stop:2963 length:945 start_codon:yes stop_codon:yes gene_type:complete